jgi:hypothetical protein
MSYRCLVVFLVGCASAGSTQDNNNNDDDGVDAAVSVDAAIEIDAPTPCTAMTTTQLLVNPALDATPAGMGWVEMPFNATLPIITTDDGIAEQTPTLKAWLGGFAEVSSDQLYQDVVIPAGTSELKVSGHFAVATTEVAGAGVKDTASIELTEVGGTLIESVKTFDNTVTFQTWTVLDHTVANLNGLSGQTVRLVLRSSSDAAANTNFFFDSLGLTATHCQ